MVKLALGCAVLSIGGFVFADGTMKPWATLESEGRVTGTSPTNAVSYLDSGNWENGSVPAADGENANFPETLVTGARHDGLRFVSCSGDLTVGGFVLSRSNASHPAALGTRVCFLSDGKLVFSNGSAAANPDYSGRIYADIDQTSHAQNVQSWGMIEFCGDFISTRNLYISGSTARYRLDYYANSSDPVRVNPIDAPRIGRNVAGAAFVLYAPKGADEQHGVWSQTQGSPYLFRTGGSAHPLAVGTLLHGTGIPEGTFLRRVFSDSMVEMSASAGETVADNAVTFEAFTPQVYQTLNELTYNTDSPANFGLVKYRPQDILRVEVLGFAQNRNSLGLLTTDTLNTPQEGEVWYPGTLVVHDTSDQALPVRLGDCHLEFAETGKADVPSGLPNPLAVAMSYTDTSVSRITVTNGITAVMAVTNLIGTLVKDGDGTLAIAFNGELESNTGALVVEGGRLELTCGVPDAVPTIGSLTVGSGATVKLPSCGLSAGAVDIDPGATIEGPGVLAVPADSFSDYLAFKAGIRCANGASVAFSRPGSVVNYDPPATGVVGDPAFWVDVSKASTLTYAKDENEVWRISDIRDVRDGDGFDHPSATAPGLKPELVMDADGEPEHIYFERVETKLAAEAHTLVWDRTVPNICVIFKVMCARVGEGGGQLLGGEPFRRGPLVHEYKTQLFAASVSSRHLELLNGQLTVNGEKRDWGNGFAYPGGDQTTPVGELVPQVVEFQTAERVAACASDGFEAEFNNNAGQNGGQRLYECLVYTNMLTETEKTRIRGYLMKKWLNAEVNCERVADASAAVGTLSAADAGTVSIDGGTEVDVGTLSGSGTLVKDGKGGLFVDDLSDASTSIEVSDGTLTVRSFGYDRAGLPDGAEAHFDFADLTTLTTVAHGSRTRVQECRDWRGADYPTLNAIVENKSNWPGFDTNGSFVPVTINGYKTAHFGDGVSKSSIADCTFLALRTNGVAHAIPDVRSVFGVYHSIASGGIKPLGVSDDTHALNDNGHAWGIRSGTYIFNANDMKKVLPYAGPGATRVRVNGADKDPRTDSYNTTGDNQLSVVTYEQVGTSGIGMVSPGAGSFLSGNFTLGETLFYRRALSRENAMRVEAYLRNKWFNETVPGYRPAVAGRIKVAAGATLNVYGSAPLTASSVSCAGTISGSVSLTADAVIEIPAAADGTIPMATITGKLDASRGGVIRLVGCGSRLQPGRYTVIPATSFASAPVAADWTFETVGDIGRCVATMAFVDGALVVDVSAFGMTVILK